MTSGRNINSTNTQGQTISLSVGYAPSVDIASFRLLLSHRPDTGGSSSILAASILPVELLIVDEGPDGGDIGIDRSGTTTTKQTYTSTWIASSSGTYRGDQSKRSDTTDLVQGYNSSNGDGHAVVVFASANSTGGETGKSIATALTGATLKKVEVYLYANHWYYNSGGTGLIRAYDSTTVPATGTTPTGSLKSVGSWPKPGGKWVDITSISTTAIRGVTVGKAGSTNLLYYGRFNGASASSAKPQLRLTYTK